MLSCVCCCRKTRTLSLTFATIITVSVGVTRHVATLVHQFDFSRAQRSIDLEDVGERAIVLLVLGVGGRSVLLEVRLVCFDPQINRNCARGIHTHTHASTGTYFPMARAVSICRPRNVASNLYPHPPSIRRAGTSARIACSNSSKIGQRCSVQSQGGKLEIEATQ